MFTIALDPGHGINTAGKRCNKKLDPNETREWVLNNRVCNYIEKYLEDYSGYVLFRVDDSVNGGKTDIPLPTRVKNANTKNAGIYLSVHHNALDEVFSGGGIMAFSFPSGDESSIPWRDELYDALIKHTGLKGNRSEPKTTANFYVLKYTKMPAVLLELGYMDSTVDVPIILTEKYAQNCAKAIVEVLVRKGKLKKIAKTSATTTTSTPTWYKVQVGAYKNKTNAVNLQNKLKAQGFTAILKVEKDARGVTLYKVQVGAYKNKANAVILQSKLNKLGYKAIIKIY